MPARVAPGACTAATRHAIAGEPAPLRYRFGGGATRGRCAETGGQQTAVVDMRTSGMIEVVGWRDKTPGDNGRLPARHALRRRRRLPARAIVLTAHRARGDGIRRRTPGWREHYMVASLPSAPACRRWRGPSASRSVEQQPRPSRVPWAHVGRVEPFGSTESRQGPGKLEPRIDRTEPMATSGICRLGWPPLLHRPRGASTDNSVSSSIAHGQGCTSVRIRAARWGDGGGVTSPSVGSIKPVQDTD